MIFEEYKIACKRHVQACESLLENLKDSSDNKQRLILQEVYYLAGYIFECIFKYAIFVLIDYEPQEAVEKLNRDKLSYEKHIKHHKISILRNKVDEKMTGNISSVKNEEGIEPEIMDLFKNWGPKFRYEKNPSINEEKIKKFFDWGKKTRQEILDGI